MPLSRLKGLSEKSLGKNGRSPLIQEFFSRLYHSFGPQGWWPTTGEFSTQPQYWPHLVSRDLTEDEKFEICLGAILTQNTSWSNVVKVLSLLKSKNLLHLKALIRVPLSQLQANFRSSGYFRQKALRVRNFLMIVNDESKGHFSDYLSGPLPVLRAKLLSISGIGPETADSILLYAGGHPSFVVDAYTRRVGSRWGILKGTESYDGVQKIFMDHLPKSTALYGEFHALIVELAKRNCRKKPNCKDCPVQDLCAQGIKEGKIHGE